jgi:hypothetical protein
MQEPHLRGNVVSTSRLRPVTRIVADLVGSTESFDILVTRSLSHQCLQSCATSLRENEIVHLNPLCDFTQWDLLDSGSSGPYVFVVLKTREQAFDLSRWSALTPRCPRGRTTQR